MQASGFTEFTPFICTSAIWGQILFLVYILSSFRSGRCVVGDCLLLSPLPRSSSAITVGGSGRCCITGIDCVWGALIHVQRPEVADGCDILAHRCSRKYFISQRPCEWVCVVGGNECVCERERERERGRGKFQCPNISWKLTYLWIIKSIKIKIMQLWETLVLVLIAVTVVAIITVIILEGGCRDRVKCFGECQE